MPVAGRQSTMAGVGTVHMACATMGDDRLLHPITPKVDL